MSNREKQLLRQVEAILWEDWDPIGVNHLPEAHGEYDSYAPALLSRILCGDPARDLDFHLSRIETDSMGLAPRPSSRRERAIARLLALRESG